MNGPIDLDLREIENREWQLWFMATTLIMVLSGIIIATYFLILGQTFQELSYTRSMAYRALSGVFVLTTLFCIYLLHTHFIFRKMRALLVDISRMMASPEDLNVLLSTFACRIAYASAVTVCQIALLTRSGIGLKLRSIHAVRKVDWKPQIGKAYPLGRLPACRQVIETLQPIVLHQKDIPHLKDDDETRELLTGGLKNLRSVLVLPMVTKGRVMGIIILGETRGFKRSRFSTSMIVLAQALARQAATTIDHVRLIEGMQKTSISLLEATLDSTADGILVVDRTGRIVSFNLQFAGMWRIPQAVLQTRENDAVLGYVMHQLNDPEHFLHKIKDLNAQPEAQSYDTIECKDGRIFESFSQPQLVDGEAVGRVWSFRDVTERKRAEETLAEQAIRDSLTNLYNRRYFNHRIEEEIARADRNQHTLAILLCDLDHFRAINDTGGHQVGDEVLKAVAREIQESTRGADLVFRWGGDEIVVVLSDTTREGILIAGERLRRGVRTVSEQAHVDLDLSIGVALYPDHGRDIDELIRLADRALYIAKKGGDKIHIGEEEYQLDEHSIKVVFQPVVDIRSDEILGYEALSRDAQGKLSILDFFGRYQAIGQLNELKRICFRSQLKVAGELGLKRVFINVDFNVLNQLELPTKPSGMEVILEISEVEALHDIENHLKMARKWRAQGYKFAIDDFGAGFISLPFIAQLIPDYIKLDRSTILQAVSSEEFRRFLKDLVLALHNYVREGIITEGIETSKELQVVREIGIHIVQGFLLGKPQELK